MPTAMLTESEVDYARLVDCCLPHPVVDKLAAFMQELPQATSWMRLGVEESCLVIEADGALNAVLLPYAAAMGSHFIGVPTANQ